MAQPTVLYHTWKEASKHLSWQSAGTSSTQTGLNSPHVSGSLAPKQIRTHKVTLSLLAWGQLPWHSSRNPQLGHWTCVLVMGSHSPSWQQCFSPEATPYFSCLHSQHQRQSECQSSRAFLVPRRRPLLQTFLISLHVSVLFPLSASDALAV